MNSLGRKLWGALHGLSHSMALVSIVVLIELMMEYSRANGNYVGALSS